MIPKAENFTLVNAFQCKFMTNFFDIRYVFIDEELFLKSILSHADLFPEQTSDTVYIYDADHSDPQMAIEFSTYDGFALKNILHEVLNLPVHIISHHDRYSDIIEQRIKVLKCAQFHPNIQNKAEFFIHFCKEQHCNLNELLYFGNDLDILTAFVGAQEPNIVTTKQDLLPEILEKDNISIAQQPHAIRKWVDEHTQNSPEVCAYYNETRKFDNLEIIATTSHVGPALFLDIDGTCTDGSMIFADDGVLWKRFSKRDIQAIKQWNELENLVFFVTGAKDSIPLKFAELTHTPTDRVLLKSGSKKLQNVLEVCAQYGIQYRDITYVGDDCNDIGIMEFLLKNGGNIACPSSAIAAIKSIAHSTRNKSSDGAIAEIIHELLLKYNLLPN